MSASENLKGFAKLTAPSSWDPILHLQASIFEQSGLEKLAADGWFEQEYLSQKLHSIDGIL